MADMEVDDPQGAEIDSKDKGKKDGKKRFEVKKVLMSKFNSCDRPCI